LKGRKAIVVMPNYNDWESIRHLLPGIDRELAGLGMTAEIVIVDDASTSGTGDDGIAADELSAITAVTCITLTRNLGSQRSIAIGVAYAADKLTADYLVVCDSDHEDKPADIPRLLEACASGGNEHIIFAERTKRSESRSFRILYAFYRVVFRILTSSSVTMGSFSVSPWDYVYRISRIPELWNHFPGAIIRSRLSFRTVKCTRGARAFGQSRMNLVPLMNHAFNGFALFSDIVATRAFILGLVASGGVMAIAIFLTLLRLLTDVPILGWTTIILSVLFVAVIQLLTVSGLMLFMVAILRMLPPLIPVEEYPKFTYRIETLYKSPD
jgi:glycosyltransferase involved in cell wall biosynthesis